jgi:hypothetical protein
MGKLERDRWRSRVGSERRQGSWRVGGEKVELKVSRDGEVGV